MKSAKFTYHGNFHAYIQYVPGLKIKCDQRSSYANKLKIKEVYWNQVNQGVQDSLKIKIKLAIPILKALAWYDSNQNMVTNALGFLIIL